MLKKTYLFQLIKNLTVWLHETSKCRIQHNDPTETHAKLNTRHLHTNCKVIDRTMALGPTQPLTEMNTRNLKKETWG
jgi:hypothetical protein